jgi:hypothetical protein
MSAPANGSCDTCGTADGDCRNEQNIQVWVGWYEDLGGAFCGPCATEKAQQLERDRDEAQPAPMVVRTTDRNGDPVVITVSVLAVERDVNDDPVVVLGAARDRMDRDTGWSTPEGADHIHQGIAAGMWGGYIGGEQRSAAFVGFRP